MSDNQKLEEILSHIHAPEPDKTKQAQAVNAAMQAFEEKNKKNTQGSEETGRLTNILNILTFRNIGRKTMNKRFVIGGTASAVAACAVLLFVTPMVLETMDGTISSSISPQLSKVVSIGNGDGSSGYSGGARRNEVPPAYQRAVRESDKKDSSRGIIVGNSALPTPVLPAPKSQFDAISEKEQPLLEWKRAGEPGRVLLEAEEQIALSSPPVKARAKVAKMKAEGMVAESMIIADRDDIQPHIYKEVGEDEFKDFKDNSIKVVGEEPVSTFSIDVDTASYSFMRRMINNGSLPQKDSIRVEELINYFDYDYSLPENAEVPFQPNVAVYPSPWNEGNKLIHIGIKGHDIAADEKPHSNLVFLIDTSGSMHSADKLPLLINSFKLLLDTLEDDDTVALVTYAGSAGVALEPTKAKEKRKIIRALENLRSGGSTAGAAGIHTAYELAEDNFDKEGVNRVILATDGDFNVGIRNHQELQDFVERKRDTGIFLSVLGFGQGNYHDNLMQTLAQNGNGNAAYIDSLSEARKVLVDEASSTLFTIAKDVKIQVEFNPDMISEYRLVGYETRHLNREDFNNDKIDAGEIGAGHTVTAIYEITPTGQPQMVDPLRYSNEGKKGEGTTASGEYAFLKMRYKLPEESESKLLTRPITIEDELKDVSETSPDMQFAAAVAGFAQILRGGYFTSDLTFDDVITLAKSGRGDDEFGYRNEFINLVRLAKKSSAMQRR